MQPSDGPAKTCSIASTARLAQRHFLWLLLASYALATLWPGPGMILRNWHWAPRLPADVPLSLTLLLLALLLFSAAILTDIRQIRSVLRNPELLLLALLAVWLGPALLVRLAGWLVPLAVGEEATAGLLVGLALIASMPVANSSVGWTQNADGNLALGLALVLFSIVLSPWVTPHLLGFLSNSLSPRERDYCLTLVTRFSGRFFIVWVIFPTAAGLLGRYWLTPARVARHSGWFILASAAALLLLNYVNSAPALPSVFQKTPAPILITTLLLAIALCSIGLAMGWAIARALQSPPDTQSALLFGLSMKHTGLALILAGSVLVEQPLAILLIALATLVQHLLAGILQWFLLHRGRLPEIPSV